MIFGINTTSNISAVFYINFIKFGAILKYRKWYLCQISRTIHAITFFIYTTTWEIQSSNPHVFIFIELFCVGEKIGFEVLDFGPAGPDTEPGQWLLSQYFGFPNSPLSSWISWFQNLEWIFLPFLCNSCDEIIWWFWLTIVTVIFTCRYFKIKLKYLCSQSIKWQEFLR